MQEEAEGGRGVTGSSRPTPGKDWDTEPLTQVKEQWELHNCVKYFIQKQCDYGGGFKINRWTTFAL